MHFELQEDYFLSLSHFLHSWAILPLHHPTKDWRFVCLFVYLFFFQGCTHGIWRFPGQWSNPSHSCWPMAQSQQCRTQASSVTSITAHGNARSLTERGQRSNLQPHGYQLDLFPLCHNGNSYLFLIELKEFQVSLQRAVVKCTLAGTKMK